jgi:hypothetical protein
MSRQLTPLWAALLSTLAAHAAAPPLSFNAPQVFAAGDSPNSVAVGDFNHDGKLDLVTADGKYCADCQTPPGTVTVLLGNGDGTFQPPVSYKVGPDPIFVVAGDFNNDGNLDLAVANFGDGPVGSGSVSILLGNGDGTFQPALNYSAAGPDPVALAVGDFNNDGNLDLAAANPYASPNAVTILLGNGDGTFGPSVNYPVAPGALESIAAGDFNGDGILDIAAADDGLSILLGNGDGTFQPAVSYPISGAVTTAVVVADFNRDGNPDVTIAGLDGSAVYVFLGNGDGAFQPFLRSPGGYAPYAMVTADFNGDGIPDLAVAGYNYNNLAILLGNGDGTFQPPQDYFVGSSSQGLAAGDFNGDGKVDLAVSTYSDDAILILTGKGNGSFHQAHSQTIYDSGIKTEPKAVAAADLNGDGLLDLALATANPHSVTIMLGNGHGGFQPPVNYKIGGDPTSITVADFNGDGVPDLAVTYGASTSQTGTVAILLGNGDGTFQPAVNYTVPSHPTSVAAGDFNGDGNLDLAVACEQAFGYAILLGNGDGTFQKAMSYPATINPLAVVTADFNGDGKLDLAMSGLGNLQRGTLAVFLGNGDGTFQTPVTYSLRNKPDALLVATFIANNTLDLAVACDHGNAAAILLGNGDGTFQSPVYYPASFGPASIALGDFNNDGKADLALAGSASGTVAILLGNGDGTFQPEVQFLGGGLPQSLAVGDFYSNGRTDVLLANPGAFSITMLANTTP